MRRPTDALEREIKFSVGRDFRLPAFGGRPIRRVFTSTYFDTDDYRLLHHGLTLRYRDQARGGRWQLKLPTDAGRRELDRAGRRGRPPAALTDALVALLGGARLRPIAQLRTKRRGFRVADDGLIAEVTLDAVEVLEGGKVIGRFDEVEAELIEGDPAELHGLAKVLRKAGARPSDQRPKLFRALDLAYPPTSLADVEGLPPIEYLKELARQQVRHLLVYDARARLGSDPEDIHQMRVALRRLRAYLRAARSMLSPGWAERLRAELAWAADGLALVRDLDVLIADVRQRRRHAPASQRPLLQRVVNAIAQDRRSGWEAAVQVLESERYLTLVRQIESAAASPLVADPDVPLESIARAQFKELRRAVRRAGKSPSDETLHQIRIRGKRARHAAELAQPVRGKAAGRFIRQLEKLQDVLGEHQDAIVAAGQLRALVARHDGRTLARGVAALLAEQSERTRAARDQWGKTWAKIERAGLAAWR
jgi:CHAD domain-containing protein